MFTISKTARSLRKLAAVFALVLLTGSFAGCNLFPEEETIQRPTLYQPVDVVYNTAIVSRTSLVDKKDINAYSKISQQESISVDRNGYTLKAIYFSMGDDVKEGDIIMELDNTSILSSISQTEFDLQQLRRTLSIQEKQLVLLEKDGVIDTSANTQEAINKLQMQNNIASTKFSIQTKQDSLRDLQEAYENTLLRAPFDGELTFVDSLDIGEAISASSALFTVSDESSLRFPFTFTPATGQSPLVLGQEVVVLYEGQEFEATISLTPRETLLNNDIYEVECPELAEVITYGDRYMVRIIFEEKDNVLAVPSDAVRTDARSSYVYVLEDGVKRQKSVSIGMSSSDGTRMTEIVSGLNEGEVVIIR